MALTDAATGAASGATLGSALIPIPGVGTAIGAGIGGLLGLLKKKPKMPALTKADQGKFTSSYLPGQLSQLQKEQQGLDKSFINKDYLNEARGGQQDLAAMLQARAAGTAGPSIAEQQLQAGQEQNLQAALAQQASARGGFSALGQRQMLNQAALGGQQVNQQAALLRSQEQQQAESALGALLQSQRQGDLGVEQLGAQEAQARESLTQQYVQMGLSLQQAQFAANQELAKLKLGTKASNYQSQLQQQSAGLAMGGSLLGSAITSGLIGGKTPPLVNPNTGGLGIGGGAGIGSQ